MKITDIRIRPVETEGRMKAVASVTFDGEFVVHDIKIIIKDDGTFFIAMPSKKTPSGEFKDIAHPINSDFRTYIQSCVIDAYKSEFKA